MVVWTLDASFSVSTLSVGPTLSVSSKVACCINQIKKYTKAIASLLIIAAELVAIVLYYLYPWYQATKLLVGPTSYMVHGMEYMPGTYPTAAMAATAATLLQQYQV